MPSNGAREKIVLLINNLGVGGAEHVVVDEANELFRRGIPVSLITLSPEPRNSYMRLCVLPESNRVCLDFKSLLDIAAWMKFVRFLRIERPRALVTHLWYANTIGRIAARIAGVKIVLSFEHNVYDTVKTRKQFFVDYILQIFTTRIFMATDAIRASLVAHHISPSRLVVFPNGVDLEHYRAASPGPFDFDTKGEFVYFFAGRLIPQKGVDVLLQAFSQLNRGVLVIAGAGGDRAKLEMQAQVLGITARVHFLGIRDDIPSLMKAADCFVMPSRHEGMPIVLIEALTVGTPIIVSDFSSARQIVRDEVSAIIVPIEDSEALAHAMQKVMEDASLRESLSTGARKEADRFSISAHIDTLLGYASSL